MKKSFFISLILLASHVWAQCNLNLIKASANYIIELENAKLRSYQNSSVCEVLDQEFGSCSKSLMSKLENTLNIKEVLGNYCQPHLPPYPSTNKEHFLKGAQLFSWKESEGYYWYAILPKTNHQISGNEIMENKISYVRLLVKLGQLPSDIHIYWNSLSFVDNKSNIRFSLPAKAIVKKVEARIAKAKLTLAK